MHFSVKLLFRDSKNLVIHSKVMLPAKREDDGEKGHQFEQVLAQIGRHDTQLQEIQEEERDGVVHIAAVDVHLFSIRLSLTLRLQRTVPQT